MCDNFDCINQYLSAIDTYQYVSWGALGLTLVCIAIAVRARSAHTLHNIRTLTGMLILLGFAKIVIGVVLLTALKPTCNCGYNCCDGTDDVFLYYPYICFVLGLCWIARGVNLRKQLLIIMLRRQGNAERTLLITPGAGAQQVLVVQNQQQQQQQQYQTSNAVPPPYEASQQQQQQPPPPFQQQSLSKSEQDEPGRVN